MSLLTPESTITEIILRVCKPWADLAYYHHMEDFLDNLMAKDHWEDTLIEHIECVIASELLPAWMSILLTADSGWIISERRDY